MKPRTKVIICVDYKSKAETLFSNTFGGVKLQIKYGGFNQILKRIYLNSPRDIKTNKRKEEKIGFVPKI